MDTTAIETAGLAPLQPTLDSIAAIRDRHGLARFLGSTLRADVDALNNTNFYTENLFGLWVAQDLDDPSQYSPFLLQGGLGMPDRSYYLDSVGDDGDDPRQVPAARRSDAAAGRRGRRRTPRPRRSSRLETRHRRGALEPGGSRAT